MKRILVVEDTQSLRDVLCTVLEYAGYAVSRAESAELAYQLVRDRAVDLVLCDYKLPKESGIDLLAKVREFRPALPFVIMTAYGTLELAVEALRLGANEFLIKPFEPDALLSTVEQVLAHEQVIHRPLPAKSQSGGRSTPHPLIAHSQAMKELLGYADKVAPFDSPVFITGESGTGKELLARYIHQRSARRDQPIIAINCGAIPEALLESELFGHEAGAFTGATRQRIGLFEAAADGTLLLDELIELAPVLQVKLLRAVQEQMIRRVGASVDIKASPRIIAATNKDPETAMSERELRADLYYRLAVVPLHIPPLRERREDILPIADYFLEFHAAKLGREKPVLLDDAARAIQAYPWPGNVRELEHRIERAVVLSENKIGLEHLGLANIAVDWAALTSAQQNLGEIAQRASSKAEHEAILAALKLCNGDKMKAAIQLGVSYKTLLKKLKIFSVGQAAQA